MLIIDGVKYEEWTPTNEDEFEQVVKEHARDIFSEQSIYLDRKQKLKSLSGIGSIPDGYVIIFEDQPHWHIVEVELSSHPLYEHIVPQISKFISGIRNPSTQRDLVDALFNEIDSDEFLRLRSKKAIGTTETYKFLAELISKPPVVTIIIEKHTPQLDEAVSALAHSQIKIVELQTFARAGVGLAVHAHLFEPLYGLIAPQALTVPEQPKVIPPLTVQGTLQIALKPSSIDYRLFHIPKSSRRFFPGYEVPFKVETDIGEIETRVTAAPKGTKIGDLDAGAYISGKNLGEWYRQHPQLRVGDKVSFEVIEPMKRYRLRIA